MDFTVIAYIIALGWMSYRGAAAIKRMIDVWSESQRSDDWFLRIFWPLAPLTDGIFWTRVFQFAVDLTLSSLGMMFTRIAIAGRASAPIGALFGLACSAMITGSSWYYKSKTKQTSKA